MTAKKVLRPLGFFLAGFRLFFGLLPLLVYGIYNTGVAALLLCGLLTGAVCLTWDRPLRGERMRVHRRLLSASDRQGRARRRPVIWTICAAAVLVWTLGSAVLSAGMLLGALRPAGQEPRTVIVLGCQVVGDKPSKMLAYRLDAAERYLKAHPDAPVVVSGGQSASEDFSEAWVMRSELVQRGIAEDRVYLEDRSVDTEQNLRFSARVIGENGLPEQVAVASDSFHQMRAAIYAGRNGLSAVPLSAKTPLGLLPSYWVREYFALAWAAVFR